MTILLYKLYLVKVSTKGWEEDQSYSKICPRGLWIAPILVHMEEGKENKKRESKLPSKSGYDGLSPTLFFLFGCVMKS